MQTFLPYADFERSARVLDDRRLGKQRVEALQVVRARTWPGYGWQHHPVTRMWTGWEEALVVYGRTICREWQARGFADTCDGKIVADAEAAGIPVGRTQTDLRAAGLLPPWLGRADLHRSHRSALVRKDPEWYRPRFPTVPDDLDYVWPVAAG